MKRRTLTVTAVDDGKDYVVMGWKADEVIEAAGTGPVWSKRHGGWLLYPRDVPDFVAAAQYRNLTIEGELPPMESLREHFGSTEEELFTAVNSYSSWTQLDLFGEVVA